MIFDWSRCRLPPFEHQKLGVQKLLEHPFFALFDEMGAGKTKQAIDAAQFMFEAGLIDRVVIVAPASVRGVWYDPEFGELAKHLWEGTSHRVSEYHNRTRSWIVGPENDTQILKWWVTNYEFIRMPGRLAEMLSVVSSKTLLILDESSAVKNYRSKQTKACMILRRSCGRVVLLNGTPIANNLGDMYSQGLIMSKAILGIDSWFVFRSEYAVLGTMRGVSVPVIVGWRNVPQLQQKFAPYVLRRLKKDCIDLPEKLPPVTLTPALTPSTWKIYKEMRDEMVAWLKEDRVATAQQAMVKSIRLAQITSGFVGGIEAVEEMEEVPTEQLPSFLLPFNEPSPAPKPAVAAVQHLGTEKQDFLLDWVEGRLEQDENLKLILWCRFRPQLEKLLEAFRSHKTYAHFAIEALHGGQKRAEREAALRLLDPRTTSKGPGLVLGTTGTGGKGVTMTAAYTTVNVSFDYSLEKALQSDDRTHRPGQVQPCSYFDIVATGPKGQKTIDHVILAARRGKLDVATFTTAAWRQALLAE